MENNEHLNTWAPTEPNGPLFAKILGAFAFIILGLLPFAIILANQIPFQIAIKALLIYFCGFTLFWALVWIGIKRGDPRIARRAKFAAAVGLNFKATPEEYEGRDITSGSVIAGAGTIATYPPYDSLLSGTRNGYSFRVVDYSHWSGDATGKSFMVRQTVICIDLKPISLIPFSIISRPLLENNREVGKTISNNLYSELDRYRVVVVDEDHQDDPPISNEFIHLFSSKDFANVEYIKDFKMDRLLVYEIYKKLTGNNYFEWIDYAITLAEQLQKDHPTSP